MTTFKTGMFLAVVPTDYEIYAVAATEKEAKRLALNAALEWLQMSKAEMQVGKPYKTQKQIDEWIGCNVYPLSVHGVGQQG